MDILKDGSQHKTLMERLISFPLPQYYMTDKEWSSSIVSELEPYFVMPRMSGSEFLAWLDAELGIREPSEEERSLPLLQHDLDLLRKGDADSFWILKKNDRTMPFFEYGPSVGVQWGESYDGDTSPILIGYDQGSDVFFSNSAFLENTLIYFRGVDPEDLQRDSGEMYPVRNAKAYAVVLDGVLRSCSAYRGTQITRRILSAKSLTVSGPEGKAAVVPRPLFTHCFRSILSHDVTKDTRFPQDEADRKYRLEFVGSDDSRISLCFGGTRLYYGEREYFELGKKASRHTVWLDRVLACSSRA